MLNNMDTYPGRKDKDTRRRDSESEYQNLTFISSFLRLRPVPVLSPSSSLSPRQVPSRSNSPEEKGLGKAIL